MEEFIETAPSQVIDAMQHTVTNMLGSLTPQFFDIRISTIGENLKQLMYSVMMSGYMFRNAHYRLELRQSLDISAQENKDDETASSGDAYASKAQKTRVQGEVVRWHYETGVESMPAVQYMDELEDEVIMLRGQLEDQRAEVGGNDLLDYIKSLEPSTLEELTEGVGEDIRLAMTAFIQRLMVTTENTEVDRNGSESTVVGLARMLYWLMVVGFNLRTKEVRLDMDRAYSNMPTMGWPDDS